MKKTRTAFTVVELLVVIAIIGILIGILLPAMHQVREAARTTACSNKSRQLALAAHEYESALNDYPTQFGFILGEDTPADATDDLVFNSYIIRLAPYFDAENQSDLVIQRAKDEFPSITYLDEIDFEVPTSIPGLDIVKCPSMVDPIAIENFAGGYPARCRLDYMPCEGYLDTATFTDFRSSVNLSNRIAEIKDGTSNKLLFGESQGEVVSGQRELSYGYAYVPFGLFINWAFDVNYSFVAPNPFLNPFQDLDGNQRYSIEQFSSPHPQIVVFSLCDGSVQFMDRSVHPEVLIRMASLAFDKGVPEFLN